LIGGTKTMHLICLFSTVCTANFAVAWTIPMDLFLPKLSKQLAN